MFGSHNTVRMSVAREISCMCMILMKLSNFFDVFCVAWYVVRFFRRIHSMRRTRSVWFSFEM